MSARIKPLQELVQGSPPDLRTEVRDFGEFLLAKWGRPIGWARFTVQMLIVLIFTVSLAGCCCCGLMGSKSTTGCEEVVSHAQTVSTILQNGACSAPCWRGIVPGESTTEEVESLLRTTPEIETDSVEYGYSSEEGYDWFSWRFTPGIRVDVSNIYLRDGRVSEIEFVTHELTVADAVNRLGDPEWVVACTGGQPDVPFGGSVCGGHVRLLYQSEGIVLDINAFGCNSIALGPGCEVGGVTYFDPKLFDHILTDHVDRYLSLEEIKDMLQEWHGYDPASPYINSGLEHGCQAR